MSNPLESEFARHAILIATLPIKGQVGDRRFAKIDGIGKDSAGNLYVLSEPWGKAWDEGRTGGTDLYAYSPTGKLLYNLRSLNFEAIAPDPATDAKVFYSGVNIFQARMVRTGSSSPTPLTLSPIRPTLAST